MNNGDLGNLKDTYMNMLSNAKVYGRVKNHFPLLLATANPRCYMCKFWQRTKVTLEG